MTRKFTNFALLFALVIFATALARAQAPTYEKATSSLPNPQIEFAGKELYDANGAQGTRYKLSVTNRASHPAFLWQLSPNLPPCGNNENASRTWVEIFGSPGSKRLGGFCALRSSADLAHLWFAVPSGEKGPPCVYIVMTDRQSGKKYISNRVCSRSFTVVTRSLKGSGQQEAAKERLAGNREVEADKPATPLRKIQGGFGWDSIAVVGAGNNAEPDSGVPTNRKAKALQPDLRIRQFLFPPTNDKALRVHVVNTGQAAAGASRLFLTVRKINGVAVGRRTHVNVPVLVAGGDIWLHIDVKSILPNNVSLQSTTFKLNVDATEIVAESNEANNEVWHNL